MNVCTCRCFSKLSWVKARIEVDPEKLPGKLDYTWNIFVRLIPGLHFLVLETARKGKLCYRSIIPYPRHSGAKCTLESRIWGILESNYSVYAIYYLTLSLVPPPIKHINTYFTSKYMTNHTKRNTVINSLTLVQVTCCPQMILLQIYYPTEEILQNFIWPFRVCCGIPKTCISQVNLQG